MAAMLFHTMNNLSFFISPTLETELGGLYLLILNIVFVAEIIAMWGPKTLVRKTNEGLKNLS